MKSILTLLCLLTFPAFAKTHFDLNDKAILGTYKLVKPDKKSDLKTARIKINSSRKLVITTDRTDDEYELTGPDEKGVIYSDNSGEPNCDGDESSCSYDAAVEIKLGSTKGDDGDIPQVKIEITVAYAWDKNCGEHDGEKACKDDHFEYVLNWSGTNPDDVSYYKELKNTRLQKLSKACDDVMGDLFVETPRVNYFGRDLCSAPVSSFHYRSSFEEAFPYVLQEWLGGNQKQPEEVKASEVKALFARAKKLASLYKNDKAGKVTSEEMIAQVEKIEAEVLKYDRYFAVPLLDRETDSWQDFFIVDTHASIISKLHLSVK